MDSAPPAHTKHRADGFGFAGAALIVAGYPAERRASAGDSRAARAAGYRPATVTNGGPRIDPDLAPLLFEPFRRLADPSSGPSGAGLGLSIVRSVAAAHQGSVIARSGPAGGLDVSVLLPGSPPAPDPAPAPAPGTGAISPAPAGPPGPA